MTSSPIDEIKSRLDIVDVIGGYVKLQKTGQNFRALCPFHSEKTPSFFVSPSRQIWHCFGGCSEGGDIFKFIMKIERVEFGDALRLLAQKAGIELKKEDPKIKDERERLYKICEITTKFFEKYLEESKVGKEAKAYLLQRAISEESIKKWRIGYAPNTWKRLSNFLLSRDYSQEEIKKAGLGLSSERGSFYDRFRGRIIFPILDLNSRVVGFSGRVFVDKDKNDVAKYINTPQGLLYDKGRILYGLDKAKEEIRKKNACILVEGNTDLIMVHQAGFQNAVAVSGTALTTYQLNILKRYSDNLFIAFDMDTAGQTATKRGIDLAQEQDFNIKIVTLPEGKDPAEIISKDPKKWEKALEEAKTIYEFYFDNAFLNKDIKFPEIKKEVANTLLLVIKKITNKIEQSYWIQKLAERLMVKTEYVEEELKKTTIIYSSVASTIEENKVILENNKSRKEMIEERIISLALKSPKQIDILEKNIIYFSSLTQKILTNIKKGNLDFNTEDQEIKNFLNCLSFKAEIEEIEEKDIFLEIQSCLKEFQLIDTKNQLHKISEDIKNAEQEKDFKKIEKLTQEFNIISKSFFDLKN